MTSLLSGLNNEQQRAVTTTEGPLLILAGAGSGKTKTLTHRIAYIIEHERVWPSEILAVTFTNKAAKEMRARLAQLLGVEQPDRDFMPWMGTFHSVCVRMLRIDGGAINISSNFTIYDEDDRRGLIKRAAKELEINDSSIKPASVSSIISSAKSKLQTVEDMKADAKYPFQQNVAKLYELYENMRIEARALDFDDLLIEVVRLLREAPEVRKKWQKRFRYILIDEYQDTNAPQYAIVKLLVNEHRNLCVVGDDWQSIYSWRGADFTNILNFERDFPGCTVVKLEQNYRSTSAILDAANSVIHKNSERTDKKLWTAIGEGKPIEVISCYDDMEEANRVGDIIQQQVDVGSRSYNDFAILYRTNAQSYQIERALRQRFIPNHIVGGMRFFDRAEIKDIMGYVKLAYQPFDVASFVRIANVPKRGVGATSLDKFLLWQQSSGQDIVAALSNAAMANGVTARARVQLEKLGGLLRQIQAKILQAVAPSDIIEYCVDASGYRNYINDGTPQADDRIENIGQLIGEAKAYGDIETFLEEVALMSSADTQPTDGSVTLMTLHSAKGLEFPVVFMVGLEEGVLPHSRVFDATNAELEEERRLCYVGMTRAREELFVCYAASRQQFGQRSYNEPSRFLDDMGLGEKIGAPLVRNFNNDDGVDYEYDEAWLQEGQRVRSPLFGVGEIIEVDGLAVVVDFGGKRKKLNAEYARLERLDS